MQKLRTILVFLVLLLTANIMLATKQEAVIYTEERASILLSADHPDFTIKIKSNPSTGYSWFLRHYDSTLLQAVKHTYEKTSADRKVIGTSGYELWTFHMKPVAFVVPMQTHINLVYIRPWEMNNETKPVIFSITTTQTPIAT